MSAQLQLMRLKVRDQSGLSRSFFIRTRIFGQVRDQVLGRDGLPRLERAVLGRDGDRLGCPDHGEAGRDEDKVQLQAQAEKVWRPIVYLRDKSTKDCS